MTGLETYLAAVRKQHSESEALIRELEQEVARRTTHPLHDVALRYVAEEGWVEPDLELICSKYGLNASQARTIRWYVSRFQEESDWLYELIGFGGMTFEGCPEADDILSAEDESEAILTFAQLRAKYESGNGG